MPDRILKPDSGNDLILQNDDASAKMEINEDGSMTITGTLEGNMTVGSGKTLNVSSGTFTTSSPQKQAIVDGASNFDVSGGTFTTSSAQKQAIVQAGPGSGTLDVSSGTFTTSTAQKQSIISGGGSSEVKGLVPVGAIFQMAFTPGSTWLTTNRFLICDGSSLNSSTDTQYADLYSAIQTTWGGSSASAFNIPDLRGSFLRGTGTGTINARTKAGPSVGAFQEDELQAHAHKMWGFTGTGTGGYDKLQATNFTTPYGGNQISWMGGNVFGEMRNGGISGAEAPRSNNETFPYNAGVQFIIKF